MSRVRYLQLSAVIPVLLPLPGGLVLYAIASLAGPVSGNSPAGMILWFLAAVPFIGSILVAPVYAVFVATILLLLRGRPEHFYRRAALAAPPVFAAVSTAYLFALGLGREAFGTLLAVTITYSLVLGYASVAVAFVGLRVLSARGYFSTLEGAA